MTSQRFSAENINRQAESMVWSISRRIYKSMDSCKWNHYENSTTFLNGPTSWLKHEELIDDWLDFTVLGTRKTRTNT